MLKWKVLIKTHGSRWRSVSLPSSSHLLRKNRNATMLHAKQGASPRGHLPVSSPAYVMGQCRVAFPQKLILFQLSPPMQAKHTTPIHIYGKTGVFAATPELMWIQLCRRITENYMVKDIRESIELKKSIPNVFYNIYIAFSSDATWVLSAQLLWKLISDQAW